jgi:hypothetical protein
LWILEIKFKAKDFVPTGRMTDKLVPIFVGGLGNANDFSS